MTIRLNDWSGENPYGKVKKLKLQQRELHFLTQEEITRLLDELSQARNRDALLVTEICLSIGCRWGEAQSLKAEQVHHGRIHLTKTKNSRNRAIPVDDELIERILEGRPKKGPLFSGCQDTFEAAIERAGITLPRGQMTHVLRHTFASHYMMNTGDLLGLSKILGHQTIQMTMIYAHLAPDHLAEAVANNPLSSFGLLGRF